MTVYVVLLRAVNVGGTGKLAMTELSALCTEAGCDEVRTYIQSGNVVLSSRRAAAGLKKGLEKALSQRMGKPASVLIRTAEEMRRVVDDNPFRDAAPNRVLTLFLDEAPAASALRDLKTPGREEVRLHGREIYAHYPDGMGRSKLVLPFADVGTGRNLNTVNKLAQMASELRS